MVRKIKNSLLAQMISMVIVIVLLIVNGAIGK